MTNQMFGLELCAVQQDTIYPHQDYEQVNFSKKIESLFHWLVLHELEKRSLFLIGYTLEHFNRSLTKIIFLSTFPTSLRYYAKGD